MPGSPVSCLPYQVAVRGHVGDAHAGHDDVVYEDLDACGLHELDLDRDEPRLRVGEVELDGTRLPLC